MSKYYNSIDSCPILLFIKISENKKTVLELCFDGKSEEAEAKQAWEQLYDEYVQEFGVSTEYKHYVTKKCYLCALQVRLKLHGESWVKPLILITLAEIQDLEKQFSNNGGDFNEILGKLAKKMGFAINPSKTTIREFYSYLKV